MRFHETPCRCKDAYIYIASVALLPSLWYRAKVARARNTPCRTCNGRALRPTKKGLLPYRTLTACLQQLFIQSKRLMPPLLQSLPLCHVFVRVSSHQGYFGADRHLIFTYCSRECTWGPRCNAIMLHVCPYFWPPPKLLIGITPPD